MAAVQAAENHGDECGIVFSRVGTPPFLRDPPPFFSEANLKSYPPPPLSESHPNWCM